MNKMFKLREMGSGREKKNVTNSYTHTHTIIIWCHGENQTPKKIKKAVLEELRLGGLGWEKIKSVNAIGFYTMVIS